MRRACPGHGPTEVSPRPPTNDTMRAAARRARFVLLSTLAVLAAVQSCSRAEPEGSTYFDERILPILLTNCVRQTGGCHITDAQGRAAGNLDLTSYDALMRRRDTLPPYTSYPLGLLLLKATEPVELSIQTMDPPDPERPGERIVKVMSDIRHAGGATFALDSDALLQLRQWIDAGFTRDGTPREPGFEPRGDCAPGIDPDEPRFDPGATVDEESYDRFVSTVQPVLVERCGSTNCHGNLLRVLFVSCGETREERRWNHFISIWHLTNPVEQSEMLRRPLAVSSGGAFHLGGDVFENSSDPGYQAILEWARDLVARDPAAVEEEEYYITEPFRYFVNRVIPTLVKKGCAFQNCHSQFAQVFKFLGGSRGSVNRMTQHRNHGMVLSLLSIESDDPNQSRIIAKNLFTPELVEGGEGIAHRGGSLLEDFGVVAGRVNRATPDDCDGYDLDNGDLDEVPAYCILVRLHQLEREESLRWNRVNDALLDGVLWVARPLGLGETTDFDTYRPGADLRLADAPVIDEEGNLTLGDWRSLNEACGLDRATADIRRPTVSFDGLQIAFAARSAADEPLRLYWAGWDGTFCEPVPDVAADVTEENGILTHDFDPAFAPEGEIVFASTRGNLARSSYSYQGPTRTPGSMEPNANLYVYEQFTVPPVRQLTFLLNQELRPSFQATGAVVYMFEKREPDFHQLSLRQQFVDGGLFLPFFGARETLGFRATTEMAELMNRNFLVTATDLHAPDGAGMLVTQNLSLGADQGDRDPNDPFYFHAMRIVAPGVLGGRRGVFRSPAALPTGRAIVSCDLAATDMAEAPFDFDLCELDIPTGRLRVLTGEAGLAEVDAVAVFRRYNYGVEESDGRGQLAPRVVEDQNDAVILFHDFPMQVSLMFTNTRTGRPIDFRIEGFDVFEALPPPPDAVTFDDVSDYVETDDFGPMYHARRRLGHVPLLEDDSAIVRLPGGTPILYQATDESGNGLVFPEGSPFAGMPIMPREEEQYYPGERSRRGIVRRLHNAVCGFCHGGMSGREVDATINPDSITAASVSLASSEEPVNLNDPPDDRGPIEGR